MFERLGMLETLKDGVSMCFYVSNIPNLLDKNCQNTSPTLVKKTTPWPRSRATGGATHEVQQGSTRVGPQGAATAQFFGREA